MLEILYHDDHLVAIHKPSGLLVHRTALDRHETRFAVQLLRDQIGREVWPAHRLDRGTSGVLLFALNKAALANACGQFADNSVEKTYLAVVRGWPPDSGVIDHPLTRQYDEYEFRQSNTEALPQMALTRFERLATVELPVAVEPYPTSRYALVRVHPQTGRRHQIRRHLKHIAHPIIGDSTHGKGVHNRMFQEQFGCHRMLLACTRLVLAHPESGSPLILQTRLDADYMAVLTALGWQENLELLNDEFKTLLIRPGEV